VFDGAGEQKDDYQRYQGSIKLLDEELYIRRLILGGNISELPFCK
jgi:hypothetical protein